MFKKTLISAMLISAGAIAFSAAPALAITLPIAQQTGAGTANGSELLMQADHRRGHRVGREIRERRQWDRRRHGDRCTRRYGNCRHFYGGYYYANPWWLIPTPYIGTRIVIGGDNLRNYGSRHVRWCENRYRSYNPRNNTWLSYSGEYRQCVSPYSY